MIDVDCRGLSLVVSAVVGRGGNFGTKLVLTGLSLWLGSMVTALSVSTTNHVISYYFTEHTCMHGK